MRRASVHFAFQPVASVSTGRVMVKSSCTMCPSVLSCANILVTPEGSRCWWMWEAQGRRTCPYRTMVSTL